MDYSSTYDFYEKKAHSIHNRRCIDGKITGCGNCVGYCQYEMHPGFLTKELRQEHNCIKKGCYYYIPKPRKIGFEHASKSLSKEILSFSQAYTTESDGIKFVRADKQSADNYTIYYIAITNDIELNTLKVKIQNQFICNVNFVKLSYTFDVCEQLFLRL